MPAPPVRQCLLQGPWLLRVLALLLAACALGATPVRAQGVELSQLKVTREDGALTVDFAARVILPRAVEDAMQRGVPVYFVAEARLMRHRWYWRDERVARIERQWRVAYQPLTATWRVGLGGFNQSYPTLSDAMATVTRSAGWKLAELSALDPDSSYYVEFSYRLDNSQLPSPMQLGLGGQAEWTVGIDRVIKVEPAP
ncbi:MAG: hypothetical protein ABT02_21260 [Comamonadaceae bacterium SCN 68-20]|nr:MAG: hypothetical protein ABT02_21260 [Comamonadaceae bacterium SCN 68-20]